MQSFSQLRETTNPYLRQLFHSTAAVTESQTFSWRAALGGRFDVLHVHWPEVLVRGNGRTRTWLRRAAVAALLVRLKIGRHALVRTLHNVAPHESGPLVERWLLRCFDRSTDLWITLTPGTPVPVGSHAPSVTIAHGDYRSWFYGMGTSDAVPGRILYFGLIRPYKGVDSLLAAFHTIADKNLSLHIIGGIQNRAIAQGIADAAESDERISTRLEYVSDADLALEVGRSELVVLPYRDMHNSGAALLALSLDRPILVPENAATAALSTEVGPGWVLTFTGELSGAKLLAALKVAQASDRTAHPDLHARDWQIVGSAHLQAYRAAFDRRR